MPQGGSESGSSLLVLTSKHRREARWFQEPRLGTNLNRFGHCIHTRGQFERCSYRDEDGRFRWRLLSHRSPRCRNDNIHCLRNRNRGAHHRIAKQVPHRLRRGPNNSRQRMCRAHRTSNCRHFYYRNRYRRSCQIRRPCRVGRERYLSGSRWDRRCQ